MSIGVNAYEWPLGKLKKGFFVKMLNLFRLHERNSRYLLTCRHWRLPSVRIYACASTCIYSHMNSIIAERYQRHF